MNGFALSDNESYGSLIARWDRDEIKRIERITAMQKRTQEQFVSGPRDPMTVHQHIPRDHDLLAWNAWDGDSGPGNYVQDRDPMAVHQHIPRDHDLLAWNAWDGDSGPGNYVQDVD